jgi:hypothetical protein
MKFINYLESISGVEIFPFTSLLIFFIFFVLLTIKVSFMRNNEIKEISKLPLEEDNQ